MNAKQERFIQEFLLDLNATQAAVRAGYSRKTAAEQAFALLRKPQIRKAIDEATDERAARTQADQDAVIRRLVAVAFADLGDFSQWDAEGNLTITPFEELDPEKRQAIKDVTTSVTTRQGRSGEIVVDACHHVWCQLGQYFQRAQVFLQLCNFGGARNDCADLWVVRGPSNGQLRQAATELGCDDFELRHGSILAGIGQIPYQKTHARP